MCRVLFLAVGLVTTLHAILTPNFGSSEKIVGGLGFRQFAK
jgi:hypothetical protein